MSNQKDMGDSRTRDAAFTEALGRVSYLHDLRADTELAGGSFATMQPAYERAVDDFAGSVVKKYGSATAYLQDLSDKVTRTAARKGLDEGLDIVRNGGPHIGQKDLALFDRLLQERAAEKPTAQTEKKSLFSFFAVKKPETEWDRHREDFSRLFAVGLPQAYFGQMRRLKDMPDVAAPAAPAVRADYTRL